MFAVACSTLARPSLPVTGRRDVAHSFDRDGQPHDGHLELARGARGTWRHRQWRFRIGDMPPSSRPGSIEAAYMAVLSAAIAAATSVENFVTETAIPSLALERHTGEERHA
jgi:hypothetical protein